MSNIFTDVLFGKCFYFDSVPSLSSSNIPLKWEEACESYE